MSKKEFGASDFRAELVKIMPGYSWTVHKPICRLEVDGLPPSPLMATGIQSSGFNRLSTLVVERRERDGIVTYTARSAGYGKRADWLHEHKDGSLARALRGLQDHYKARASDYRLHECALERGRKSIAQEGEQ